MATNGIVSVTKNKKTVLKIVAGCNGFNAQKVANCLAGDLSDLKRIRDGCLELDFGCGDCLVVMNKDSFLSPTGELPPLYFDTFQEPKFNPRWESGTAQYIEVIEI